MADHGQHIIRKWRSAWTNRLLLSCLVLTVALTVFFSAFILKFTSAGWIWVPPVMVISAIIAYLLLYKKISVNDVASYIDKSFPPAEDSTSLLLKPEQELNYFEKRQVEKINRQWADKIAIPPGINKRTRWSIGALTTAGVFALLVYFIPVSKSVAERDSSNQPATETTEKRMAGISSVSLTVIPPKYTGRPVREQGFFNVRVEEDGVIRWKVKTSVAADSLSFLFNDSSVLHLEPGADKMVWSARMPVAASGFYQVRLGNTLSDFYRIEMLSDQLPEITVHSPAATTTIEPGMSYRTMVNVSLSDDYGISASAISATIASGTGESVAFREQRIAFDDFVPGGKSYTLKKKLDLQQLKMVPGDELYFYITATDSRKMEKRSDMFIVRIEDTTGLMSLEGLASGIDIKPEYFRSQRQIIIETEQLLKDRAVLSKEAFNNKSNDLGIDQKLLRLRYGKFLGEETDTEIGGHEEAGHNEQEAGDIMDQYMHKHDNAEDATFFDAETKKQLKATLAEMWKAELQLRSLQPKDALPFEYKALRLLKNLQQKTRAYVSKTGIKTTPLDPKKRLSADLDGIQQFISVRKIKSREEELLVTRKALGILELLHYEQKLSPESFQLLQQSLVILSERAAKDPAIYLPALASINRVLNNHFNSEDLDIGGRGLLKVTGSPQAAPVKARTGPDKQLSDRYFKNIAVNND
jgi:hypothetical protein